MNGKYIPFVPVGYTGGPNDTSIFPPSHSNQTRSPAGHRDPNIILLRDVIEVWLCTPITVLGILGNLVSLVVLCYMRKGKLRAVATMLQALAVSDTLVLVANFWLRTMRYLAGETFVYYHAITFPVLFSTNYVLRLANTWLTVLLTFDRYVVVCHPLHAQSLCTTKRTYIQIVCCVIASFAFCVPRYFESKVVYTPTPQYRTTWLMDDPLYAVVYRILLFLLVQYILPMVILIALNGRVVWSLRFSSANQPRFSRNRPQKYKVSTLKTTHSLFKALVISTTHEARVLATTHDASAGTSATTHDASAGTSATPHDASAGTSATINDAPASTPATTHDASAGTSATINDAPASTPATTHDASAGTSATINDAPASTPATTHDDSANALTVTRKSSASSVATTQDASASSTTTSQHSSARTLTRIVVAVVLLCTVCHVVSMVSHVLLSVQTAFHQLPGIDLWRRYFSNISNLLITFNSAVNFLIYCALSRNFRAILNRCLTGVFRRGRHPLRTGRSLYPLRRSTMTASSRTKRGGSSAGQSVSTPMSMTMMPVNKSKNYQGIPTTSTPLCDTTL